jgi:hypothetical protein
MGGDMCDTKRRKMGGDMCDMKRRRNGGKGGTGGEAQPGIASGQQCSLRPLAAP